ncbi:hypothetical protein [Burkholderia phage FLC9]|nr:hypothetical protein [Burkholderia phage FLC9]
MKNVANIKAFAANLSAVVYMNKHFVVDETANNGDTVLYRVHADANGDFVIEGFRASMADGDYKTFEAELAEGNLWVGSKRRVFDYLSAKDRASTELSPLVMPFMDSKYEEFFIAEAKPLFTRVVKAVELEEVAA